MNIGELISTLDAVGLISITGRESRWSDNPEENGLELNDWLDKKGVDPESPIPAWNEEAQAWEL